MEFHEKLLYLRRQKGITQEDLAEALYVSRTAVSKWESGRGLPNIESLKAISKFYSVSLDDLLSGDTLMAIAEESHQEQRVRMLDLILGLLDLAVASLYFLPFWGQPDGELVRQVSLVALQDIQPWLKIAYWTASFGINLWGVLLLTLQNWQNTRWMKCKFKASLILSAGAVSLYIVSRQVYASIFVFVFLITKTLLLLRKK